MDSEDGDDGGLEEAFLDDQEGIMQYLENAIGEEFEESEFIDDFRNSELFADVLRELGMPVASGSSNPSSRRPSLNESDRGTRDSTQNRSDPTDGVKPPVVSSSADLSNQDSKRGTNSGPCQSSSKNVHAPTKTTKEREETKIENETPSSSTSSDSDAEDFRARLQKNLKDKLKKNSLGRISTPVSSSCLEKERKIESPKTKHEKSLEFIKKKGSSSQHHSSASSTSNSSSDLSSYETQKRREKSGRKSLVNTTSFEKYQLQTRIVPAVNVSKEGPTPSVHLMDLVLLSSIFRNRNQPVLATSKLLEEVRQLEMKMRLSCSECVHIKPLPRTPGKTAGRLQQDSNMLNVPAKIPDRINYQHREHQDKLQNLQALPMDAVTEFESDNASNSSVAVAALKKVGNKRLEAKTSKITTPEKIKLHSPKNTTKSLAFSDDKTNSATKTVSENRSEHPVTTSGNRKKDVFGSVVSASKTASAVEVDTVSTKINPSPEIPSKTFINEDLSKHSSPTLSQNEKCSAVVQPNKEKQDSKDKKSPIKKDAQVQKRKDETRLHVNETASAMEVDTVSTKKIIPNHEIPSKTLTSEDKHSFPTLSRNEKCPTVPVQPNKEKQDSTEKNSSIKKYAEVLQLEDEARLDVSESVSAMEVDSVSTKINPSPEIPSKTLTNEELSKHSSPTLSRNEKCPAVPVLPNKEKDDSNEKKSPIKKETEVAKKRQPMSFDKLAILNETLNKAKTKKDQVRGANSVSSNSTAVTTEKDKIVMPVKPQSLLDKASKLNEQTISNIFKETVPSISPTKELLSLDTTLEPSQEKVDDKLVLSSGLSDAAVMGPSTLNLNKSQSEQVLGEHAVAVDNGEKKGTEGEFLPELSKVEKQVTVPEEINVSKDHQSPTLDTELVPDKSVHAESISNPCGENKSAEVAPEVNINVEITQSKPSPPETFAQDQDTARNETNEIFDEDVSLVGNPGNSTTATQNDSDKLAESHEPLPSDIIDVEDTGYPSDDPGGVENLSRSSDVDDSINSSSPEILGARKSMPPERITPKKKKIIESSSDDGDHRRDDTDVTDDLTPERKKSSDEEVVGSRKGVRFAPNPSIERKRDDDARSGKFGEFEMERQRKKDKRKPRDKREKRDPLEEIMKDKQLSTSFRIPKKTITTSNRRTEHHPIVTPLTCVEVPKENMQFERFRKGLSDKDKIEKKEKERFNRNRGDSNLEYRNRMNKEPDMIDKHKLRDEGRVVLLASGEGKDTLDGESPLPGVDDADKDAVEDEPAWADDGEEPGGGVSPDNGGDNVNSASGIDENDKRGEDNPEKCDNDPTKMELDLLDLGEIKNEKENDEVEAEDANEPEDRDNPEVPIKTVELTPFSIGATMLLQQNPQPNLPDVDEEKNLAEATVMKLAWWFSRSDFKNSSESGCTDDWYSVDNEANQDGDNQEDSDDNWDYLYLLQFSYEEENEVFLSLTKEQQRRKHNGPVDEACGRQLLVSKYRSGPDDKFSNIFQLRPSELDKAYEKENFQAQCTLCDFLVIGRIQLANHVLSDSHKEKMSKAGLDNVKLAESNAADKQTKNGKENLKDKSEANDKSDHDNKGAAKGSKSPEKKDDEQICKDRKSEHDTRKDKKYKHKEKKRKRSKDGSCSEKSHDESGAEIGVTSTGLPIKIPAGAIPDKNKSSDSKGKRSRSRSPRHKRNRSSRSPRHQSGRDKDKDKRRRSRSKSPYGGGSNRRRSRSRDRDRNRPHEREPVVRISRSPGRIRRRSTSTERVEKFLAKTQRSRSPSNGYRKRNRIVSPPGNSGLLPKKTNKEFHEKLALTMAGKWTDELENKWKIMEAEEAIFMEQFGEKSKNFKSTPESYPNYGDEWTAFWERRYQEIEEEGKEDPEKHNYVPEWKEFWTKRLDSLLEKQYDDGIKDIKIRNGVDIDTLQKIRNTRVEPASFRAMPGSFQPQAVPTPQPVPPPNFLPMGVPPPRVCVPQTPSITGTITPSSKSVSEVEDTTSRPMSISDGGDNAPDPKKDAKRIIPTPAVTTNDIMSTWEKLKSGGLTPVESSNSASSRPVHQPLRSLSIARSDDARSFADSSVSIESYPFSSGMDVVQVLLHMTSLEDQLSFFADKVKEYFKQAEEMDLQKAHASYKLLTDEDFVAMLFQIRDRFMAMIRSSLLPRDVLDKLNLTVYGLNAILDHPDCQKRRPKLLDLQPIPEKQEPKPKPEPPQPAKISSVVNNTFTRPTHSSSLTKNPYKNLSVQKKKEIAKLVTNFLMSMGREDLSDKELRDVLWKMSQQSAPVLSSTSNIAKNLAPTINTPQRGLLGVQSKPDVVSNRDPSLRSAQFGSDAETDPWRIPDRNISRFHSVASFHGPGTAVPELHKTIIPQMQNPTGASHVRFGCASSDESGGGGGSWRHSQTLPVNDNYTSSGSSIGGRHSPFSRRDATGNPVSSNPYRDKASCAQGLSSTPESRQHPSDNPTKNLGMPVVTVGTTSKLPEIKRNPQCLNDCEIQLKQLTKYRTGKQCIEYDPENKSSDLHNLHYRDHGIVPLKNIDIGETAARRPSRENDEMEVQPLFNLPPGIRNMILEERNLRHIQENAEAGEVLSNEIPMMYYHRRRKKKKKRKRRKVVNDRDSGEWSSDDSDDSQHARDRSKERRRRRDKTRRKREERKSSSSSPDRSNRRKNRTSPSPSPTRHRDSRKSRSGSCKTASGQRSNSQADYQRREGESRPFMSSNRKGDGKQRQEKRQKRSPSVSSHESTKSGTKSYRHRSGKTVLETSDGIVDSIKRRAPPRHNSIVDENSKMERCQSTSPINSEILSDHYPCEERTAPPRGDEFSCDRLLEFSPVPRQRGRQFLRESNLKESTRFRRKHSFDMYAPSPPASINSGSSGYRRTKQRPNVTTVNMLTCSNSKPPVENWEILSEVSSLESKDHGTTAMTGASDKYPKTNELKAGVAKVTSVSKTFWTEKDEDAKSLCSISSHEIDSPKKLAASEGVENNLEKSTKTPVSSTVNQDKLVSPCKKVTRKYRSSLEVEKEPGEISSSNDEI